MHDVKTIESYCNGLLAVERFDDYCPNGLQVEGDRPVRRLLSGVTASQALIDAAVADDADAILVHHGYFWKGESPRLTGMKGRRVRTLMRHGMHLLAYHLPLDAHPELGNNRQLGQHLGLVDAAPASPDGLLWQGRLATPQSPHDLAARVGTLLARPCLLVGERATIARIAWCTGGAQGRIEHAAALGVDAYLSGEIAEQTTHQARELGICYLAAGHHATERYGAKALGEHLAERFGLAHRFLDIDNPA